MPKKPISSYSKSLQNKIKLLEEGLKVKQSQIEYRDGEIAGLKARIETQGGTIVNYLNDITAKDKMIEAYQRDIEAYKALELNWAEMLDKSQNYKKQHETERDTAIHIIEKMTGVMINGR